MRVLLVALVLGLFLGGCIVQKRVSTTTVPAGEWMGAADERLQLVAFARFASHYHDQVMTASWDLMPQDGNGTEAPARCAAFRNGAIDERDSCSVTPPSEYRVHAGHYAPWNLAVVYKIHRSDDRFDESVLAYDGDGRLVANWTGEAHPNMDVSIE